MDLAAVPLAPPGTDSASLIIWIISALVVVLAIVGRELSNRIKANEKAAAELADRCQRENAANHAKITELYSGVVVDQKATQAQTNGVLAEVGKHLEISAKAANRVMDFLERETESGRHQARNQ